MAQRGVLHFFVDRVEGETAVLLYGELGEGRIEIPLSLLPVGVGEGDALSARLSPDVEKRAEWKRDIDHLLQELGDDP